ncbi:hypothetical protein CS542_07345 [Pedobacter sp. IW39]|nr:hypothetical protein CS542_07345 [Pedobacter sp. IW39]
MYSDNNATRTANVGNGSSGYFLRISIISLPAKDHHQIYRLQERIDKMHFFQRHNLPFRRYYNTIFMSGGYQDQDGIVDNTAMKTLNFRSIYWKRMVKD